jgi:aromatic-amino-acid transaminase
MSREFIPLPDAGPDPIMAANQAWPAFAQAHPDAVNTTIGVLVDPVSGNPWRPQTVTACRLNAFERTAATEAFGYQTPTGHVGFLTEASKLAFGESASYADGELVALQTAGGTGALSLADEILQELVPADSDGRIPLVLDAGWPNHQAIFRKPYAITTYEHSDPMTRTYNHAAALDAFDGAPEGSVFLLQSCGYNDDGNDRTPQQWQDILTIAEQKQAIVLFDSAYLGLAQGFEHDRSPIEESVRRELFTFVTFSASKNMGLYGERLGALFVANAEMHLGPGQTPRLGQLAARCVRRTESSLPTEVAMAAAEALSQQAYYAELSEARERLASNRAVFGEIVADVLPAVTEGHGLFTKLLTDGFTQPQLDVLRGEGIHVLPNSRINLGGLQPAKVERVGLAVLRALQAQ